MRPNIFFVLFITALITCTAGAATYRHEFDQDVSPDNINFNDGRISRNPENHDSRIARDDVAAGNLEERGWLTKLQALFKGHTNSATKLKASTANTRLKANPELSKAIANPEVSKSVKKLAQDKEFVHGVKNSPVVNQVTKTLRGNPAPLTKKKVEAIGAVTLKSSGIKLGYGGGMILAAGVFMLFLVILGLASGSS